MNRFCASFLLTLGLVASAQAQTGEVAPASSPNDRTSIFGALLGSDAPPSYQGFRAEGDYLFWWFKPNETHTPLIGTLADPTADLFASIAAGGLADPNSVVIFGGGNIDRGPYSGARLTLAWDPSDDMPIGFEVSGFWFPGQGTRFSRSSNAQGNYPITLFFFDTSINPETNAPYGETAGAFAGNGGGTPYGGFVDIRTHTQLWGSDANLSLLLYHQDGLTIVGLGGFRYAGLRDELTIHAALSDSPGSTFDRFLTSNQFYGGQIGMRILCDKGLFRASLVSKLAAGMTYQDLNISGNAIVTTGSAAVRGAAPQLPGGFYTAASNIGSSSRSRFGVVSETNFGLNAQLMDRVNLGVGYSLFYWSGVMRSGEQVTRQMNFSTNPNFAPFAGGVTGALQPGRLNNDSSFWAHGLNFTLGLNF